MENIEYGGSYNKKKKEFWHHPTQLHWSGTSNYPAQDIYSKAYHFLDFIILLGNELITENEDEPASGAPFAGQYIKFWVDSENRGLASHYVKVGKYVCYFYLVADNAKRKRYKASFVFKKGRFVKELSVIRRRNPFRQ